MKRWVYIVEDNAGGVSYHASLEGAKRRADTKWIAIRTEGEVWCWRTGMGNYQITIRKVRLWE